MTLPSPERQAEFLATMPDAIVATIGRDGTPQLTPNWFLWTGGTFWVATVTQRVKIGNLRRDPRIVLCIDDPVSGDYVQVRGRAELVVGDEALEPTMELCRKYLPEERLPAHREMLEAEGERVLIVVHPERFQWHDH